MVPREDRPVLPRLHVVVYDGEHRCDPALRPENELWKRISTTVEVSNHGFLRIAKSNNGPEKITRGPRAKMNGRAVANESVLQYMGKGNSTEEMHHVVMRVWGREEQGKYGRYPPSDLPTWAHPSDDWLIHHKNLDHGDNRIENLIWIPRSLHSALHSIKGLPR